MPAILITALLVGCATGFDDSSRAVADPAVVGSEPGRTIIHQPAGLGVVDTPLRDTNGATVGVACATCHGPSAVGDAWATAQGNPEGMHGSVTLAHGDLSCASCHDPDDRSLLRLANGNTLAMADAMQLCAQCHGSRFVDYQHGAHGGMTGHWDLSRGDRERNHCLDCHPAHAPGWAQVEPVFPPNDRGVRSMRQLAAAGEPHP
jgi:hypothetical protein